MKLSDRLLAIANLVPKNSIVGDIGTDHGYIPTYLIENKISKKVIGTDISKGSLEKIIEYVKGLGLEDKIDTRLGDGLEVIKPYEIDTLIIAGMGGLLIRDILEKHKETSDSIIDFILQPMVASKELRQYLINNNFEIIKEELVKEENKYYEIIYAKKGKWFLEKEIYYEISPILLHNKHPLLKEFVESKIVASRKIIKELEGMNTAKSKERYVELNRLIKEYEEVIVEIES
ncbi:tRNA (adenine(22)-N(1))-methyltransferase [Tissierella praeacuta]|uniref:tRNA (adenine(22)-N(1))-methyltransferase n=1 Tax=Tissierella praeacuta TaxID=43131 RepID=UPI0028B093AE|nr:class I SAM-dependent methyltransferase [Tissierella praeacuta]